MVVSAPSVLAALVLAAAEPPAPVGPGDPQLASTRDPSEATRRCDAGAFRACEEACDAGAARPCALAALRRLKGEGVARDPVRGRALYLKACEGGIPWACSTAGGLYMELEPREVAKAKALLERGCAAEPRSCFNLARYYETGVVARDPARAAEQYRRSCEAGNALACNNLGSRYLKGEGVPQSSERAATYYRLACYGDDPLGCENLASLGGEDPGLVTALLAKGCEAGDGRDCESLGIQYVDGAVGVAADPARAGALFERSCDAGVLDACNRLGLLYLAGKGVKKDPARAAALGRRACEGGNALGCLLLGRLHERGAERLPVDLEAARALYQRACEGDSSTGCEDLERLK